MVRLFQLMVDSRINIKESGASDKLAPYFYLSLLSIKIRRSSKKGGK